MDSTEKIKNRFIKTDPHHKNLNISDERIHNFVDNVIESRKMISNCAETKSEIYTLLSDLITNMTSRKKIYACDKITLREGKIFKFNKSYKATIEELVENDKTIDEICEFIKNDELESKFRNIVKDLSNMNKTYVHINRRYIDGTHRGYYVEEFDDRDIFSFKLAYDREYLGVHNKIKSRKGAYEELNGWRNPCKSRYTITQGVSWKSKKNILRELEKYETLVENTIEEFEEQNKIYKDILENMKKEFKKEITLLNLS